ncbi:MAG: hypothetical protein QNJ46_23605 [Leptolyngbyaceae cyanobacterium MO_188.B28]|nr:hypothetical protein [Leptolyngbyaceae cyanobacterium MO_188.B28]
MSRFLVGSALFAVAMLAIFGAGTANTVVSWFDNLGNPSAEERSDNSIAIAADLTPIQRAGSYVELQTTPSTASFQEAVQFGGSTGQGGAAPTAVGQAAQTTTTSPAAASDTSIPALW